MEAQLQLNNVLLVLSPIEDESPLANFCGPVITIEDPALHKFSLTGKSVYICGDLSKLQNDVLHGASRVLVVGELSFGHINVKSNADWLHVNLGHIPILIHDSGVLYRRLFDPQNDYYKRIHEEHSLQSLTESNKSGKALRTGIYLTPVQQKSSELHFRLLRCSTNLTGPTDNFRANDIHIIDALNQEAAFVFKDQALLNHVLAQDYPNTAATSSQKQVKAKISSHADKTKDMPLNGIMAFCTFYNKLDKLEPLEHDPFDYGWKGISGLTKLRFRMKESVTDSERGRRPTQFSVTLYPNSVFFMPLSTNRLYTHEIQASALDAGILPTRLGYVVRCSKTEAVHVHGATFLKIDGNRVKLEDATDEGMQELRGMYAQENISTNLIDYGNRFLFSMNAGDYLAPTYRLSDEFRTYELPQSDNPFSGLLASLRLDAVGKGRQGAVLVKPDKSGKIPIVRTTSKYTTPVQQFRSAHLQLAQQIQTRASLQKELNNALVEAYTNAYTTMGSHSDQALDLADDSFVAVYSCYQHPELTKSIRTLIVESKEHGGKFRIPMKHNSIITFSTDTNRRFKHKIVLENSGQSLEENTWLGFTFRTSKTVVQIREGKAYMNGTSELKVADDEQRREFYQLRRRENQETDFVYPHLSYTVSESDLLEPDILDVGNGHG